MKPAATSTAAESTAQPNRTSWAVLFLIRLRPPRSTLFPYTTLFRSRRIVTVRGAVAGPARRKRRQRVQERTADLNLKSTRLDYSDVGKRYAGLCLVRRRAGGGTAARVGQSTAVRGVDADGRGDGPRVGLRLGDARPRLNVGVERHGDGGQDADDRHDDQQLDQREATLAAEREPHGTERRHRGPLLLRQPSTSFGHAAHL